jgi:hypothetical protein
MSWTTARASPISSRRGVGVGMAARRAQRGPLNWPFVLLAAQWPRTTDCGLAANQRRTSCAIAQANSGDIGYWQLLAIGQFNHS